jgi:hypothetical protein
MASAEPYAQFDRHVSEHDAEQAVLAVHKAGAAAIGNFQFDRLFV